MNKGFVSSIIMFLLIHTQTALAFTNAKNLWPMWAANNPLSEATISHADWQTFLTKHVVLNQEGIALVDYLNLDETDKALLKRYLNYLKTINIATYNRNEQLAYWINLYNAITVNVIADHYPITSVESINISPGLFSIGPWGARLVVINKVPLSLDDIQNRIIRPIWNDPRTLYALNNGSIGAPNLSKQAYVGSTINKQLNEAAFTYINSLRGVQVIENELVVSKLFEWFKEDFGGTTASIITHISYFAKEPLRSKLATIRHISNYIYNWHLNSTISGQETLKN